MSDSHVVRPQDAMPDNASTYAGVRKGTVAAFVENAKNLSTLTPGTADYDAVAAQLRSLASGMAAAGIFDIFELRSPAIRDIVDGAY